MERKKQDPMYRFQHNLGSMDDCWEWVGPKTNGYGVFSLGGMTIPAHRFSYWIYIKEPARGHCIDHLCRNRACVNPDHLEDVTYAENIRRGINAQVRVHNKTHCPRGHSYLESSNVRLRKDGGRRCIACARSSSLKYYYKTREINNKDIRGV